MKMNDLTSILNVDDKHLSPEQIRIKNLFLTDKAYHKYYEGSIYETWELFPVDEVTPWSGNDANIAEKYLRRIYGNFISVLFEYPVICRLVLDDKTFYYIGEGNKRWMALKKMGVKLMRAHVIDVEYREQVGDIYNLFVNAKMPKQKKDVHDSNVKAKNTVNIRIEEVIKSLGCHYIRMGQSEDYGIRAVQLIQDIATGGKDRDSDTYRIHNKGLEYGLILLKSSLKILVYAYGGVPTSLNGALIKSMAQFILLHGMDNPNLSIDCLAEELKSMGNRNGYGNPAELYRSFSGYNPFEEQTQDEDHLKDLYMKDLPSKRIIMKSLTILHNRNKKGFQLPIPKRM